MTDDERERWDSRYRSGEYQPRTRPAPFLEDWIPRIPVGRALVVACGTGRNAIRLADAGFDVVGVDISSVAIGTGAAEAERRGLEVDWRVLDLDQVDIDPAAFDLITVFRFRSTTLWPRLVDGLAPGGHLLVEHHLQTTADVDGPTSAAFRLEPQELIRVYAGRLRILYYDERLEPADKDGSRYAIARLAAVKGDPGF